jgi:hyperosmotically inducible periplasmic protein
MTRTELKMRAEDRAREVARRTGRLGREAGRRASTVGHEVAGRTKGTRRRVGYWIAGEEPPKRTRLWIVVAGTAGAAAAFFLDPVSGKRRRHVARDWIAARVRGAGRRVRRTGRAAGAEAYGTWQAATHTGESTPPENDAVLAHKVESEALREMSGRIVVNAEEGVVVLRGAVSRPEDVDEIERRVRRVMGVRGVRNLLHLEGTPAPTR